MSFLNYRKFTEQEQADALGELFTQNNIAHEIVADRESLDSLYGDKVFNHHYFIKIRKEDFEKADALLKNLSQRDLENVEKDHYLFNFTNAELREIIEKPDEWNEFDFLLAKKILAERGETIDEREIENLRKSRIADLSKPDGGNTIWIMLGYPLAFLGGLLGIFIGWHLSTFKKTLPNGERVYGYTKNVRTHGNWILIIALVSFLIWLALAVSSFEQ